MKIAKKIWRFCIKGGLSLFLLCIMFSLSVTLVSIAQKGKTNYGRRCYAIQNNDLINFLNQEEIIAYDYELQCNTLYLDLSLNNDITIENAKALLVRISSYYTTINYNVDTQITLKGNNYLILASLVDKEITMSITHI